MEESDDRPGRLGVLAGVLGDVRVEVTLLSAIVLLVRRRRAEPEPWAVSVLMTSVVVALRFAARRLERWEWHR